MFPAKPIVTFLLSLAPFVALAHDGDHGDSGILAIAVHHAALPAAALVIAGVAIVAMRLRMRRRVLGRSRT